MNKESKKVNWYDGTNEKQLREFIGDPIEYAILTMNQQGHVHIHAPMENAFVIVKMLNGFSAEAEKRGIKYKPPTKNIIET